MNGVFRVISCLLALMSGLAYARDFSAAQVASLTQSNGIVRLNDRNFNQIVAGPRDYDIVVLLTAEGPQYGCSFCRILGPPFEKAASSWHQDHPSGDGVFFAVADISVCQNVFREFELTHAPNVWVFKRTPHQTQNRPGSGYEPYQFPQTEDQLGPLVQYLNKSLKIDIKIHEPFPWDRLIVTLALVIGTLAVIRVAYDKILLVLQRKQLWIAITLVSILMFTAGHMFNMIRRTPYIVGDGRGGATYFVGGHSNQIAVETQIIAIVYAVLSFSTICLVVKVPKVEDRKKQSFLVIFLSALIYLAFSFLIEKFKIKNGSYPFSLAQIF
ncbi:dolichyl-diphosphooligosaccharide--protein glycosyltransferase subunit 3 [Trichomonascus vanleenenianus]|uniref:dolichyl-diphosphooligosaccharide--protein glycotransferase OST3 n=1 Tax=Trichomonascus vanleenenianus TaxID=2268995 RepID=UPI003ECABBF3